MRAWILFTLLLGGTMVQAGGPSLGQSIDPPRPGPAGGSDPRETRATAPSPAGPKTLDEQLLESLGDPREELNRDKPAAGRGQPDSAPDKPQPSGPPPDPSLQKQLAGELGAAAIAEDDDPMLRLARQMRLVEERIARGDCGDGTQKAQQEILASLDALMRQSRCKGCSGGACEPKPGAQPRQGTQPPKPSESPSPPKPGGAATGQPPAPRTEAKSPGRSTPNMDEMRTLMKRLWGELPPQERQQMLELPIDEFLPEYDRQIEDYFERLSEE